MEGRENSANVTVLLGGAFNPPHLAHLLAAGAALAEPACREAWLVPCAAHPFEKQMLRFDERAALCHAMAAPFAGRLQVCEIEAALPEPSYTVRTLEALREKYPQRRFAWLIGSDNAPGIGGWKDAERLPGLAEIWVIGRGGQESEVAAHMRELGGPPLPPISSTLVRERVAAGEPWRGLVPGAVAALMEKHGYYR